MERLLTSLRAAAEPTRLRLLALAGRGAFCVSEFTEILGQSQPRLSRHLKLLCDCGLLDRVREGANVWFALPHGEPGALARDLVARLPEDDPILETDRRQAARVLAERARVASESFRRQGADWDEMRALDLPAAAVEAALLALVPEHDAGRLLDIGTGTGRVLELLAPRISQGVGVDASKAMLALARSRLARAGFAHCSVRLADMYRLPLAGGVVRHRGDADGAALRRGPAGRAGRGGARAAAGRASDRHRPRAARPRRSGNQIGASLARASPMTRCATCWQAPACIKATPLTIDGPLAIRLWPATRVGRCPDRAASRTAV